jgi:hypothetical protein
MENEYNYDDFYQNEYTIWWVNEYFEIDYSIVQGKNENEAIIDFFTNSVDAEDVKNFRIEINNTGE